MGKLLIILFLIGLTACSFTRGYQDTIDLPEGTTPKKGLEIVMAIWNDNFVEKITGKFPHFDPIKNPNKYGILLHRVEFTPVTPKGVKRVFIKIAIKYEGKLEDAKEIVEYGKSIVKEELKKYLPSHSTG
jgi:hypothetical protein